MLREALLRGQRQGWGATAVLPEGARSHEWASSLDDELEVLFLPPSQAAVANLIRNNSQKVILHTNFTAYDAAAALAARAHSNVHVIWQAQSNLVPTLPGRLRAVIKYTLARRLVDAIIGVAPHIVRDIVRRGASAQRTLYLPNAVDTDRFRPARPEERRAARASCHRMPKRPAMGLNACSRTSPPAARSASRNSIRMKKMPSPRSVECWSEWMTLAP
jgi:glycosyltransferase involved in cell wall biosynthesis